ncbi:MAG: glycerophosphodiester phosphodiesterase [Proteobacteria bacterium]|nr:glycerophosphodiester phosphodiesterase [Pseudomonadota bacterium]
MKVIAHRGACTEALENSWDAFQKAVDCGAERIELDVHLTKDGHLAVIHDESLMRTAGVDCLVSEQIRTRIAKEIRLINGEALPFLDEIFAKFLPLIEINVEVKSSGRATVQVLADLIKCQNQPKKVIVSSFIDATIEQFSREHPEISVAYLWDKSLWWPGAFHFGPKNFMCKNAVRIFHPDALLITPAMVEKIKREGWEIYPYISLRKETNREELWSYLMTLGVDGLCTNYPREMRVWLQEALDDSKRFRDGNTMAHINV